MERGNVDLRICKKGDILVSVLGSLLRYIKPTDSKSYLDHMVEYTDPNFGDGTRTNDGYVFKNWRIPETDHDIIKIIHINKHNSELKNGDIIQRKNPINKQRLFVVFDIDNLDIRYGHDFKLKYEGNVNKILKPSKLNYTIIGNIGDLINEFK